MPAGPTHAIVAVTNRCNARCTMCDIWKRGATPEMPPEAYGRLPASLREVNVTGGEPLLREDLADVILAIKARCPRVRIVLSTNGLLPARLGELLAGVGDIAVRISVDGIGDLHDAIRGTPGAFRKALESLAVARQAGVRDLGICATMSRHNAGTLAKIQDLARVERVQFTFTVAHSSPVFFGDKRSEEPEAARALPDLEAIKGRLFASGDPKDWFRAYFVGGLGDVMRGRPRPVRCRAGLEFFYLDAEGNLYPCHLWDRPLGNILSETYEEMIGRTQDVLAAVRACGRRCWMTCTVAPEMRRRLPVFAVRVGWAKARHHLGSAIRFR